MRRYNLGFAGSRIVVEDGCDPSEWGEFYTSAQALVSSLHDDGVGTVVRALSAAETTRDLPPTMAAFLAANRNMVQRHMARFLSKRANRRLFSIVYAVVPQSIVMSLVQGEVDRARLQKWTDSVLVKRTLLGGLSIVQ